MSTKKAPVPDLITPETTPSRDLLRTLVRNRYDVQRLRIAVELRLERHAEAMKLHPALAEWLKQQKRELVATENRWVGQVEACLQHEPIAHWLMGIDGIGETIAAFLLSEFDIVKGSTPSKMHAYAGLVMESPYRVLFSLDAVEMDASGNPTGIPLKYDPSGAGARSAKTDSDATIVEDLEDRDRKIDIDRPVGEIKAPKFRKNVLYEATLWGTSPSNARTCVPVYKPDDVAILRVYSADLMPGRFETQRRRRGQRTSYNTWLRTKLLGVLGPSLLRKFTAPYYGIYTGYRNRLLSEITEVASPADKTRIAEYHTKCAEALRVLQAVGLRDVDTEPASEAGDTETTGAPRKLTDEQRAAKKEATALKQSANSKLNTAIRSIRRYSNIHWESTGHLHAGALRYMVKMFLIDLYKKWRELRGLPVRPTYQEEKLGHAHSA